MHDPKDLRRQAATWRQAAERHTADVAAALTLAAAHLDAKAAALEIAAADGADAAPPPQWTPWLSRRLSTT
jgi:hypothetical protein